MRVFSVAVCHIVSELAAVNITLGMPKSALALSFTIDPVAFVVGAINPDLNSIAVSDFVFVFFVFGLLSSSETIFVSLGASHLAVLLRSVLVAEPVLDGSLAVETIAVALIALKPFSGGFIHNLDLASVDRVVGEFKFVDILETGLVQKARTHLFKRLHLNLVVVPHGVSDYWGLLNKIISLLVPHGLSAEVLSHVHLQLLLSKVGCVLVVTAVGWLLGAQLVVLLNLGIRLLQMKVSKKFKGDHVGKTGLNDTKLRKNHKEDTNLLKETCT